MLFQKCACQSDRFTYEGAIGGRVQFKMPFSSWGCLGPRKKVVYRPIFMKSGNQFIKYLGQLTCSQECRGCCYTFQVPRLTHYLVKHLINAYGFKNFIFAKWLLYHFCKGMSTLYSKNNWMTFIWLTNLTFINFDKLRGNKKGSRDNFKFKEC